MEAAPSGTTPRSDLPGADLPYCDVVMKGGVTSGIVYPLAVAEVAKAFRLRNIGGTSAGAIAAVAAAAAECGRYRDRGEGFDGLAGLPDWLGRKAAATGKKRKETNLFWLFQPQTSTRRLFDTLTAPIRHARGKLFWLVFTAVRRYWRGALPGAVPGMVALGSAVAIALLWASGTSGAAWIPFGGLAVLSVLILLAGTVVGAALALKRDALHTIPENQFGLCSGGARAAAQRPGARRDDDEPWPPRPLDDEMVPKPLAEWLADLVDYLAGTEDKAKPLTFGDLWCAGEDPRPSDDELETPSFRRVLDLAMVTTCLSQGMPYRLPLEPRPVEQVDLNFYFDPDEFRRVFPERVVKWMETHSPGANPPDPQRKLHAFPRPVHLPVVVAARLSLSFPILLSALPLYSWDNTTQSYVVCWFSDGGITSNFPIHFFDSPLPRWPTVGINLRGPRRRRIRGDDEDYVWLTDSYEEGFEEIWSSIPGVLGFIGAIKDTAQNWRDNAQARIPGSRDRVAQIAFDKSEGGLNLSMPEETIRRVSERGAVAGTLLRARFRNASDDKAITFDSHRWVRYRTATTALERLFAGLERGLLPPWPPTRTYEELIGRGPGDPPPFFEWDDDQRVHGPLRWDELLLVMAGWTPPLFEDGTPKPEPALRSVPDV